MPFVAAAGAAPPLSGEIVCVDIFGGECRSTEQDAQYSSAHSVQCSVAGVSSHKLHTVPPDAAAAAGGAASRADALPSGFPFRSVRACSLPFTEDEQNRTANINIHCCGPSVRMLLPTAFLAVASLPLLFVLTRGM